MFTPFQSFIREEGFERKYGLAYSGGLDSQVLLRLCALLREQQPFSLRAIHVHHGLSPQADRWAEHCQRSCEELQVAFTCLRVDAQPPPGESLEAHARECRYAALKEALHPGEVLLTAHHQDDQVETLLLQLLRGAGPKGLSAMPAWKVFGKGFLARPLLRSTRAELQAYAEEQGLRWIEDELNQDPHYPRNRLRQEILPLLKRYWPSAGTSLARSAELCAEAQHLLEEVADPDLARMAGAREGTLSVKPLRELSTARQRLILRRWLDQKGVRLPNAAKLLQMQKDLLGAREDAQPCVAWGGVELRRYQGDLYLLPQQEPQAVDRVYPWNFKTPLLVPGLGRLEASLCLGQGLQTRFKQVELRFRRGGEVYSLPDGRHHTLKNFFQEQNIPPWERERLPLLYAEGELLAIPGYWVVEHCKAAPNEPGWVVELCK